MDFLAMGGYGVYVWGVYGVAVIMTAIIALVPHLHHRREKEKLRRILDRKESQEE